MLFLIVAQFVSRVFASQRCRIARLLRRKQMEVLRRNFVASQNFASQVFCAAVKFVLRRNLLLLNILECNFRVATFLFRRARLRRNCSRRKTFAPQANAILASQLFLRRSVFLRSSKMRAE